MKHFLELFQGYEGSNPELIVYAIELGFNTELVGDLHDNYDDMLEQLHKELDDEFDAQNRSYSHGRKEHDRLYSSGLLQADV